MNKTIIILLCVLTFVLGIGAGAFIEREYNAPPKWDLETVVIGNYKASLLTLEDEEEDDDD